MNTELCRIHISNSQDFLPGQLNITWSTHQYPFIPTSDISGYLGTDEGQE